MEPRAEARERGGAGRLDRAREGEIAAAPGEATGQVADDLPAFAVDGDELAAAVAEVEENGGSGGIAVEPGDSGEDLLALSGAEGAGLEGADGPAEGLVRRRFPTSIIVAGEKPVAEETGVNGEDLAGTVGEGQGEERLAEGGGEWLDGGGDV